MPPTDPPHLEHLTEEERQAFEESKLDNTIIVGSEVRQWLRRINNLRATNRNLAKRVKGMEEASADDLRNQGLTVAVHNDYRVDGKPHTFWLFTRRDGMSFKGEGLNDIEALNEIRAALAAQAKETT